MKEQVINKNGIEGIHESSGRFGYHDSEGRFHSCLPIFVPNVCVDCRYYDPGEMGDYGEKLSPPYCMLHLSMPIRKGTCKRKKKWRE